jgi:23S rRNA (guanine745-N1)-methyltransferase
VLADVLAFLRCPLCAGELCGEAALGTPQRLRARSAPRAWRPYDARSLSALVCPSGHHFDVARQGYVNLLVGRPPAGTETPDMIESRARVFAAGLLDGLTAAVVDAARAAEPGLVVDAGAGTGHYLAAVLDHLGGVGIALDIAKPAVRRAARAHPRLGAAVCDIWRGLPVADACTGLLLDVFAPRNPGEFHRVIHPDGLLVVVTPRPEHLTELVSGLGLLGIDPGKHERLDAGFTGLFRLERELAYAATARVGHADALDLARMGPSAFHTSATELAARVAELPAPVTVTLSARIGVYRRETH